MTMRSEQYHEIKVVLSIANAVLCLRVPRIVSIDFICQHLTKISENFEVFELSTAREMVQS